MGIPLHPQERREATLALKVNPAAFCKSPRAILRLFPNINTMVLKTIPCLSKGETIPDTVTSLVVKRLDLAEMTPARLWFAGRIVEIQNASYDSRCADFSRFTRLERLAIGQVPAKAALPAHRLRRLHVRCSDTKDPLAVFPPECAEQISLVCDTASAFLKAKARQLPPRVRVFCDEVAARVSPADFFPRRTATVVSLSDAFGVDELRAFAEGRSSRSDASPSTSR